MSERRTVILDTSHNLWGGSHIFIDQLCNYLNTNNIDTYIASSDIVNYQSKIIQIPIIMNKLGRIYSLPKIIKLFNDKDIDTVILNDLSAIWLTPFFRVSGFKVIGLLHLFLQKKSHNVLSHSLFEFNLIRLSALSCNKLFSVGKENLEVFKNYDIEMIGNFASDFFFNKTTILRKKYDFLIVARLSKQKDIPYFIKFLYGLNKYSNKKNNLLIVGRGPEESEINLTIHKYNMSDCVEITGWASRDELCSIYDMAKCFVISSLHEGFATTILESHARGLPALVSSTSGFCVDFVEQKPLTGIVFNKELYLHDYYKNIIGLINNYDKYSKQCIRKSQAYNKHRTFKPILNFLK